MIPAGLIDNNIEFFAKGNKLFSIQSGIRYEFPHMPEEHITFLQNELDNDEAALETFTSTPTEDILRIYGICRFGGCNHLPDVSEGECTDVSEYYDCGIRGRCMYEGLRCKELVTKKGIISFRQLQVVILIAAGKLNKEIAGELDISENTVANHLVNIQQKIEGRTRVDIATFAKERGIA